MIRVDDYPNKDDYKPYVDKNVPDEMFELPLSDPSESDTIISYRTNTSDEGKPSAFAENKIMRRE